MGSAAGADCSPSTIERLAEVPPDNDGSLYWSDIEVSTLRSTVRRLERLLESTRAELRSAEDRHLAGVA